MVSKLETATTFNDVGYIYSSLSVLIRHMLYAFDLEFGKCMYIVLRHAGKGFSPPRWRLDRVFASH